MDEKKMQELNPDEMEKVSGGGGSWAHENDKFYFEAERCACGGKLCLICTEGGDLILKCESCGSLRH